MRTIALFSFLCLLILSNVSFAAPHITSPTPNSLLTGTTETFELTNDGSNVSIWQLWAGSSVGSYDLGSQNAFGNTPSVTFKSLPIDGSTVYLRLYYRINNGAWINGGDSSYTAAHIPFIVSPLEGSTLLENKPTFQLNSNGVDISIWQLWIGSSLGSYDLGSKNAFGDTPSVTIKPLPINGAPVYVRLYYRTNSGVWVNGGDYQYTANSYPVSIISPLQGSTLSNNTVRFDLDPRGHNVTGWHLWIGNSLGKHDVATFTDNYSTPNFRVHPIPIDGRTVYIRLFAKIDGNWVYSGDSSYATLDKSQLGLTVNIDRHSDQSLDTSAGIKINLDSFDLSSTPAFFTLKDKKTNQQVQLDGNYFIFDTTIDYDVYQQVTDIPSLNARVVINFTPLQNYSSFTSYWKIEATLESFNTDDRGWELQFHLPADPDNNDISWNWHTGLNTVVPLDNTSRPDPENASWHPITTIGNHRGSLSISIPPSKPVIAHFSSSRDKLITSFSLGTSPLTKNSNKASVTMNLWSEMNSWRQSGFHLVEGGGFRRALVFYYKRNKQHFERTVATSGLWTTATPERLKVTGPFLFHEHGNIFFSNTDSSARDYAEQITIDETHNLLTLPYLHIGQMSRTNLNTLPADNATIYQIIDSQTINTSPQQLTKYSTLFNTSALQKWSEALDLSTTLDSNLNPNARIRENVINALDENREIVGSWATIGKQVSFVVNPDPDIVNGHGQNALAWVQNILNQHPNLAGIYVDSISGWPQFKNYNRDHFAYSDYPLASDEAGNVYLPNAWGHIELLLELRELLHAQNKLLMGNGYTWSIDSYFLSSIVDVLGREDKNNVNQNTLFGRTVAGRRPQVKLYSKVDIMDDARVKQYINSSLSLGVLPSAWGSYFAKKGWLNADESFATGLGGLDNYTLHKQHWLRVFKVLDTYKTMKWQPETLVTTNNNNIHLERFTNGDHQLITIYRTAADTSDTVSISLVFNVVDFNLDRSINPIDITNDAEYTFEQIDGKTVINITLDKTDASLAVLKLHNF